MDSQEELNDYINSQYKGEKADFLVETSEFALEYLESGIDAYKREFDDNEPEEKTLSAMNFIGGYFTTVLSILIYENHISPLIAEIEKYYKLMIISFVLLLVAILLILVTVSLDVIQIFMFLVLPSIIGMAVATLKGIQIWSEIKKNLLQAEKMERELK